MDKLNNLGTNTGIFDMLNGKAPKQEEKKPEVKQQEQPQPTGKTLYPWGNDWCSVHNDAIFNEVQWA